MAKKLRAETSAALELIPTLRGAAEFFDVDEVTLKGAVAIDAVTLAFRLELFEDQAEVFTLENMIKVGVEHVEPKGLINGIFGQILLHDKVLQEHEIYELLKNFNKAVKKTVRILEVETGEENLPTSVKKIKEYLTENLKVNGLRI